MGGQTFITSSTHDEVAERELRNFPSHSQGCRAVVCELGKEVYARPYESVSTIAGIANPYD